MHATSRLATEARPRPGEPARTRLCTLRSAWPSMLRATRIGIPRPVLAWAARTAVPAAVHLTAAGAGPVGGDRIGLEIDVGAGSSLVLGEVSPTLLLPGPHGERSCTRIDITVGAGATLAWLPQLVIAARGCRHRTDVRIALAPRARLLLREEVLFGRHGEVPGTLHQRIRITLGDRPLYDQELAAGPPACGWAGPAVTAGHRGTGAVLVVDDELPEVGTGDGATAALALPGPGVVVTALAEDTATLRRHLDDALAQLCAPHGRAAPPAVSPPSRVEPVTSASGRQ